MGVLLARDDDLRDDPLAGRLAGLEARRDARGHVGLARTGRRRVPAQLDGIADGRRPDALSLVYLPDALVPTVTDRFEAAWYGHADPTEAQAAAFSAAAQRAVEDAGIGRRQLVGAGT